MLKINTYFFIFITIGCGAQTYEKFEINTGYGFYDAFKLGIIYNFSNRTGLGVSVGLDHKFLRDESYISGSLELISGIKKDRYDEKYCLRLNNRIYLWQIDDRFYKFRVISLNPALTYRINSGKKFYFSLMAGPAINIVVYNHRKTFEEVGWPHYIQFNPGFQLNYVLK